MSLRQMMHGNPLVGVVAAVVILGLAVVIFSRAASNKAPAPPSQAWFYNLQTGELTALPLDTIPPIKIGDDVTVRARVFGCGDCKPGNRHVTVLETYPDAVAERLSAPMPYDADDEKAEGYRAEMQGLKISALLIAVAPKEPGAEVNWVRQDSADGMAVLAASDAVCGSGVEVQLCLP